LPAFKNFYLTFLTVTMMNVNG